VSVEGLFQSLLEGLMRRAASLEFISRALQPYIEAMVTYDGYSPDEIALLQDLLYEYYYGLTTPDEEEENTSEGQTEECEDDDSGKDG